MFGVVADAAYFKAILDKELEKHPCVCVGVKTSESQFPSGGNFVNSRLTFFLC